ANAAASVARENSIANSRLMLKPPINDLKFQFYYIKKSSSRLEFCRFFGTTFTKIISFNLTLSKKTLFTI
ncbi:MAG: hypothetical protein ACLRQX_11970, partial [Turicibacter sanguinis]